MQITSTIRLVKPLGAGGMGAVWIADHLTLHTRVVVKFISAELSASRDARERFSREAAAAAAVKSPHVVQMLDHGLADDGGYIVMELLEGEDLRQRLDRERCLPLGEIEMIVTQTCRALGQAHRAGIIHRDIKPDNIFLCKNEEGEIFVKLLDFGIAKQVDSTGSMSRTRSGAVMGTPYYMSPEQALGQKGLDARTDLWSIGVVAFEAMTGTRAFDGASIGALAVAIINGPLPVPSVANPVLPPSVDAWFSRACARVPDSRFQTARELADALRASISSSTVSPMAKTVSPSMNAMSQGAFDTTALPTSQSQSAPFGAPRTGKPSSRTLAGVAGLAVALLATITLVGLSKTRHWTAANGDDAMPSTPIAAVVPPSLPETTHVVDAAAQTKPDTSAPSAFPVLTDKANAPPRAASSRYGAVGVATTY